MATIMHLHPLWGEGGGAEVYLSRLCADQVGRGYDVVVVCGVQTSMASPGVRVVQATALFEDGSGNPQHSRDQREVLVSLLKSFNPQLVLLHNIAEPVVIDALVERVVTLRYVHDLFLVCPRGVKQVKMMRDRPCDVRAGWICVVLCPQRKMARRLLEAASMSAIRRAHRRLHGLLVGSQAMRSVLVADGYEEKKIHILHPLLPDGRHPWSPASRSDVILYAGRVNERKGLLDLMQAAERLRQRGRDFEMRVVGGGEMEFMQALQQRAKGLPVTIVGAVAAEHMRAEFEQASFLVLPSRTAEAFGMVGPEAMLAGRPVVAYDVGGVGEWLEHDVTGLKVERGDIEALTDAMDRLLSDRALQQNMGFAARQQVTRFGADAHHAEFKSIMEEVGIAV